MSARRAFPITVIAALFLACSDSTGPKAGLSLAQLAGTWQLTDFRLQLVSDTTVQQDLVASLGLSATLVIATTGSATMTASVRGEQPQSVPATIALHCDTLRYTSQGGAFDFRVGLTGSRMTWRALYTAEVTDLTGDGVADETREAYGWQRD